MARRLSSTRRPASITAPITARAGPLYKPGVYPYNPLAAYPPGTKNCPAAYYASYAAVGDVAPCGLNGELVVAQSYTYGVQPRVTLLPPEIYGIANTIKIGGLFAKETFARPTRIISVARRISLRTPGNLDNIFGGGFDGGVQRTIYQGYVQDKIDLLDDTLHVTPGLTLEGTYSSFKQSNVFSFTPFAYVPFKQRRSGTATICRSSTSPMISTRSCRR